MQPIASTYFPTQNTFANRNDTICNIEEPVGLARDDDDDRDDPSVEKIEAKSGHGWPSAMLLYGDLWDFCGKVGSVV